MDKVCCGKEEQTKPFARDVGKECQAKHNETYREAFGTGEKTLNLNFCQSSSEDQQSERKEDIKNVPSRGGFEEQKKSGGDDGRTQGGEGGNEKRFLKDQELEGQP